MSKIRRKVTTRQEWEMIQVYLNLGLEAAAPLCVEYGVSPNYARRASESRGWKRPCKFRGGGDIASRVDHADPRWKLAIERGSISA